MTMLWTGRSGAHGSRTADPLGCARDDKKERIVARKGLLLEERAVAEPRHFNPRITNHQSPKTLE